MRAALCTHLREKPAVLPEQVRLPEYFLPRNPAPPPAQGADIPGILLVSEEGEDREGGEEWRQEGERST